MFIYYNKNNIVINMLRLFKLNSVLLKYNNIIYTYLVLHKLLLKQNSFDDYEYVLVDKNIEDDWTEINLQDDYVKFCRFCEERIITSDVGVNISPNSFSLSLVLVSL